MSPRQGRWGRVSGLLSLGKPGRRGSCACASPASGCSCANGDVRDPLGTQSWVGIAASSPVLPAPGTPDLLTQRGWALADNTAIPH